MGNFYRIFRLVTNLSVVHKLEEHIYLVSLGTAAVMVGSMDKDPTKLTVL